MDERDYKAMNEEMNKENLVGSDSTSYWKNKLPLDVRYLYHKGVELYQCIRDYELGVLDNEEFSEAMRKIEAKYATL